ncbi:MAG: class I SAM-dependent methyltransferase [Alphaproteobacteria bacterium]|nr:class I SAM-dependent methyltransferase [Alphaproteobacteria bacterium]
MAGHSWDDAYKAGTLPWHTGSTEPVLAEALASGVLPGGRALEIGCGLGDNTRALALAGYDALGVDLSPTAVAQATARHAGTGARFAVHDMLAAPPPGGPFDLVFDRGCFHVFDDAEAQARFARHVAEILAPGGQWLSLVGSTEGGPRDGGPPRRSARDVTAAVEPVLEIVSLVRQTVAEVEDAPTFWVMRACRRAQPAAPSTRR